MKRFPLGLVVGFLALVLSAVVLIRDLRRPTPRIAYADNAIILAEYKGAVKARQQLAVAQKVWQDKAKLLNDSLTVAVEVMKVASARASNAEKEAMMKSAQRRNEDLQRYAEEANRLSQAKEKELIDPVLKQVNDFMDAWGKKHGYDLILGTMTGGNILQANGRLNVTEQVVKELNEGYRDTSETVKK